MIARTWIPWVLGGCLLCLLGCTTQQGASSPTASGTGGAGAATSQGGAAASGGVDAGPGVLPIIEAKAGDEQGVPLRLGQTVTIRGVVTVPTGLFSIENHEIYVQDATGGISVYEVAQQSIQAALGDDLEVTGTVGQYEGKTEIDAPLFVLRGTGAPAPTPEAVTPAQLCADGEQFEGNLVAYRGVTIVGGEPWPTVDQAGNTNLTVDDGSGPCALRLDHQSEFNGTPEPPQPFDVVGVVKQYDPTSPYFSGHELQPRFLSDVTPSGR